MLLLAGSVAVHQLVYGLAGVRPDEHVHAYLSWLAPALFALLVLGLAELALRVARAHDDPAPPPRGRALWPVLSALLLAIFVAQESTETLLAPDGGHVHALNELVLGHGLWTAAPIALLVGAVLALALRGAVAVPRGAWRSSRPPRARRPRRPGTARASSSAVARRATSSARCSPAGRLPPSSEHEEQHRSAGTRRARPCARPRALRRQLREEPLPMHTRAIAAAAALTAALAAAPAQAHVTLQPGEVPAGGFTRLDVRVPNERDDAGTTKVQVQFPPGFASVSTEPKPGWKMAVKKRKAEVPVELHGEKSDQEVDTVTFIATGGTRDRSRRVRRLRHVARHAGEARGSPDVQGAADLRGRRGRPLDRRAGRRRAGPAGGSSQRSSRRRGPATRAPR